MPEGEKWLLRLGVTLYAETRVACNSRQITNITVHFSLLKIPAWYNIFLPRSLTLQLGIESHDL